ncbi:hypothetical protein ACFL3N_02820 [Candidatus Omnitrophota bacterium]
MQKNIKRKEKVRYEVDPHNRLIFMRTGRPSGAARFRKVLDGSFRTDKGNSLTYHVKRSAGSRSIPQQVKFSGSWSVGRKRDLIFTLDKWSGRRIREKLILKGELMDANANKVYFSMLTREKGLKRKIYALKLCGRWQADRNNRLTFIAGRKRRPDDTLTLQGSWEVNKNNQVIYKYVKTRLKRKVKIEKAVVFKGHWDILKKRRLTYVLSKRQASAFDFRASIGVPVKMGGKRGLKYEIGVGAEHRRRPVRRVIVLFGSWRINRDLKVFLETGSVKGRVKRIAFGADAKLGRLGDLTLALKGRTGERLGVTLKLSKRFLKGRGEAFLKGVSRDGEKELAVGAGLLW